ncbi:MAG: tetratricopeptide repeat protein [Bacteroidales bacterium]
MQRKIFSLGLWCLLCLLVGVKGYAKNIEPNYKIKTAYHKTQMRDPKLTLSLKLSHSDSALILAQKNKDRLLEADIYLAKGNIYASQGSYSLSITITNRALVILSKIKKTEQGKYFDEIYSKVLNNIGYSQAYCSNYTEALNCFSKLLRCYESNAKMPYAAWAYNGFAYIYTTQKKFKEAEFYAQKALAKSQELNDIKIIYSSYSYLGDIYYQQGLYEQALNFFLEQQKIAATHTFDGDATIHSLCNMAEVYHKKKQDKIAEQYYLNAMRLAEKNNKPLYLFIKSAYGQFLMESKRSNEALTLFLSLLNEKQLIDYSEYKIIILQCLSTLYENRGDYKKATQYLQECYQLIDTNYLREASEKLDLRQRNFDEYKQSTEQKIFQQNIKLEQNNSRAKNLWIAILSIVFLIVLFLTVYIISRIVKQRQLNTLLNEKIDWIYNAEDQRIEDKTRALMENLNEKNEQCLPDSLGVAQFTSEIETLKRKINLLKNQIPLKEENTKLIIEIENILNSFSSEKQWAEFKLLFEKSGDYLCESLQKNILN